MAGPFGSTFAPTEDAAEEARRRGGPFGGQRQQAALRVLRLEAPSSFGPQAPAADALLRPRMGAGGPTPDNAVLASIIKALLGPQAAMDSVPGMTAPPAMSTMKAPMPGVRMPSFESEPQRFTQAVGGMPDRSPDVSVNFGEQQPPTPPVDLGPKAPDFPIEKIPQGPFPEQQEHPWRLLGGVPQYKRDLIREG